MIELPLRYGRQKESVMNLLLNNVMKKQLDIIAYMHFQLESSQSSQILPMVPMDIAGPICLRT